MPSRKASDGLLARVNFPLYSVEMLTSRHVLVAGGGGSSKTGVANGFEIYEILHNGKHFVAAEVIRHETGANVVMNSAVRSNKDQSFLVAGQESHCQLYHVNTKIIKDSESANGGIENLEPILNVRQRRPTANDRRESAEERGRPNGRNQNEDRIHFEIKAGDLVQTDFSKQVPLQRVVRISPNCDRIATGGTDAHVRIWTFPQMTPIHDIDVHTKEIDDLDFSPDNKQLISIAKDGLAIIWDVKTGKEAKQLKWTTPDNVKYLFKRCRFAVNEGKSQRNRLFTIANPLGKVGQQKGFLHEWNPETGAVVNSVTANESLASLAVRDDGRFVATGTMFTGSVSIYIAFSLQRVLHVPSAHSMFVTGLEFLPQNDIDGPPISSNTEAAVLSISVDNKVCIHSLKHRHTIPVWVAVVLNIIALFLAFTLCAYIGL